MMPTDILRARSKASPAGEPLHPSRNPGRRIVVLKAGQVAIRVLLAPTATADLIWAALPLYSTVEPWGEAVHFEVPVFSGRDRTARLQARLGDICMWCEEHRVIVAFGPTPISRPDEIRMPSPVNVFATALDDVRALRDVRVGEKVTMARGQMA